MRAWSGQSLRTVDAARMRQTRNVAGDAAAQFMRELKSGQQVDVKVKPPRTFGWRCTGDRRTSGSARGTGSRSSLLRKKSWALHGADVHCRPEIGGHALHQRWRFRHRRGVRWTACQRMCATSPLPSGMLSLLITTLTAASSSTLRTTSYASSTSRWCGGSIPPFRGRRAG